MLRVFYVVDVFHFIFFTSIWSTMIQGFDKMLNGKQGCEHILQQMLHNLTSPWCILWKHKYITKRPIKLYYIPI